MNNEVSPQILLYIFGFLKPREALDAGLVCKRFYAISRSHELWRSYVAEGGNPHSLDLPRTIGDQDAITLYREFHSVWDTNARCVNVLRDGIAMSSCDDLEKQSFVCFIFFFFKPPPPQQHRINNVLSDDGEFWSSKGSADENSSEWLVFRFVQPLCLVGEVEITPYRAEYQRHSPTYSPKTVTFDIGHSATEWHWTSKEYPCEQKAIPQKFSFYPQELPIGGFLRIRLAGRKATQPGDDLFYTVLRHVRCFGIPHGVIEASYKNVLSDAILNVALLSDVFCDGLKARALADGISGMTSGALATREAELWKLQAPSLLSDLIDLQNKRKELSKLLSNGESMRAIKMISSLPPFHELRDKATLQLFLDPKLSKTDSKVSSNSTTNSTISNSPLQPKPDDPLIWKLLLEMVSNGKLNSYESVLFVEQAFQLKRQSLAQILLASGRLTPTELLGDTFLRFNRPELAVNTFLQVDNLDRLTETLAFSGRFSELVRFCLNIGYQLDWTNKLQQAVDCKKHKKSAILRFALLLIDINEARVEEIREGHGLPIDANEVYRILNLQLPAIGNDIVDNLRHELQVANLNESAAMPQNAAPPHQNNHFQPQPPSIPQQQHEENDHIDDEEEESSGEMIP